MARKLRIQYPGAIHQEVFTPMLCGGGCDVTLTPEEGGLDLECATITQDDIFGSRRPLLLALYR